MNRNLPIVTVANTLIPLDLFEPGKVNNRLFDAIEVLYTYDLSAKHFMRSLVILSNS